MNTILITGTAKTIYETKKEDGYNITTSKVLYDVNIWAEKQGEVLSFIRPLKAELSGYGDLWNHSKAIVSTYYKDAIFEDGFYTQYLDHLITIK